MLRLAMILHFVIGATLMGVGVIAILVMGQTTPLSIILAACAGFVLAIPVSWLVARAITRGTTIS
ncbi:hypothetical protein H0274_09050 [Altererythrobacter sp. CC-YST694]|uniref:hypothetical protein n=1 Tax=Altererythrobacter sp. CC-YST694 TaxID=2755038 RepID=UPI001D0134B5|nr:hypothetical protein [Altererythrobacter sp. CC-YST694]MCB5425403.1 hypothetical protein [Altererythrobacter sp. CC-YST694]